MVVANFGIQSVPITVFFSLWPILTGIQLSVDFHKNSPVQNVYKLWAKQIGKIFKSTHSITTNSNGNEIFKNCCYIGNKTLNCLSLYIIMFKRINITFEFIKILFILQFPHYKHNLNNKHF